MHRLVPEFIQEQYAAGSLAGSFEACTLFVDISGFTPITDAIMGHGQHGAEVLAGIIRDVFDPLVQSVFAQGGFVTNFAGDAFTAVFPTTDVPHGQLEPALSAAWQMQQVMTSTGQHRTPYGDFTLSIKVGLSFGEVAWGILSSASGNRAAYYFQGHAIDGCANAQKLAGAGQIVIDAAAMEAAKGMVLAEPVDDHYLVTAVTGGVPDPRPISLGDVRPEIVSRFFPPEATQTDLSGEIRQVANMFISLPTVSTVEQLEGFMQIIFVLQERYGGLLNRLDFGDKGASLLLFWGAPVAHENDVTRALKFVLDLQSQTVIPVNAGITYGIAHSGYSGGALAGEYTCHGRGTTLAARLMQASPRGEVWVDERVAERAERYFELDFEGTLPFKGFANEQKVFVLLERRETAESFYKGRLIGRRAEQQELDSFIRPLEQGQSPGALVVWGEPGIGKSRLVAAFVDELEEDGRDFNVFVCQSDEIVRESLNPFRYWLRSYLGQLEQQSDARNKRSFNRRLDRLIASTQDEVLVAELDRTRSFLGALVNLHWPDSLYEQLDAQGRYENTFNALLTLLRAESQSRPVILLVEDTHWLDDDSKAFIKVLLADSTAAGTYPIALLTTARLEGSPAVLGQGVGYQEITLDQISAAEQAQLASDLLGAPVGPDLLELLIDRAEGNPFFAEQIVRYLQEQDLLLMVEGSCQLKALEEAALPTDVRAVLVARLDRLTQYVREVVQTASILGREFELKLLAQMLNGDPGLKDKVAEAERMAIWSTLNELRYIFKHRLLRDAAYHMQIRSRRQALHQIAAESMEKLYANDLSTHYGELAYHAEQAQMIDKARRYLQLAGETAASAYQNNSALDYYGRALALTPATDLESRFSLLSASEELHNRIGANEDQARDLDEMERQADELNDAEKRATVFVRRAWMSWWMAEYDDALKLSKQAAALAHDAGNQKLAAEANLVSIWSNIHQANYDAARQMAEVVLADARQFSDDDSAATALRGLAYIYRVEGDYYAALRATEDSLAINQRAGNIYSTGTALGNLGVSHMTLGNYAAAKDFFHRALIIIRSVGRKVSIGSDLVNLAWLAQTLGEYEAAVAYAEEGIAILRSVNQMEMMAEGLLWLGHARFGLGQLEAAREAYEESLRVRRQLDQEPLAMGVVAALSQLALAQNDLEAALAFAGQIVAFLQTGGSLDDNWEPLRIYWSCYQVLHEAGDPAAAGILRSAYQKLQRWATMIPDEQLRRSYLENVPWHREITAAIDESSLDD